MSYNIHHGNPPAKPGVIDLDAIANVIALQNPDLVALQEVDINIKRSGSVNQAEYLSKKLGMHFYFAKAIDHDGGDYGEKILQLLGCRFGKTCNSEENLTTDNLVLSNLAGF